MHSLLMWAYASEGYLLAGRVDDAMKLAGNSLALVREQGAQGHEASLLRVLGAIYLQLAEWTKAEEYYKKSLLLTGQLGMRPLVAHCHLGLGRLRRRTGQRDQAREHLSTATTMYREMDMRFWLEKAAAEMK